MSDVAAAPERLLRYGGHDDQWVRLRCAPADRVCVCLLHGGYWRPRHTADLMTPLVHAAARTFGAATVANIEYRREHGAEAMRADVIAALGAIRDELGAARMVVVGHSAGGHLALLTAAHADAVVALAPVTDLVSGYADGIGEGAVAELMGAAPDERPAAYRALTPSPSSVPTLVVHGADDERVPVSQSQGFVRSARTVGAPVDYLEPARLAHMVLIDPAAGHWPLVREWTRRALTP
ncbi:S9 family peptidase [Microbacterium sp. SORGH_AS_0888]|uniref:alpha/beta hydrolase family protein n=1 Tax=Microbacterium sp. SORGH_AS_0888 TaxID=3041791 RepID=UPI00278133D4|nr:prolyl oligopeptidase family serine peptidase [Microbacterium sp. SORGH_AS_0888]MDQ1128723.1 acetyl esterase/lipase [Microbacterium sp. SORGH_AS_0888]